MRPDSTAPHGVYASWLPWIVLFLIGLVWRLLLIELFPQVYPWDPLTRLVDRDQLFVRHWLPLPQLPLVIGHHYGASLEVLRGTYAVVGAAGAAIAGLCIAHLLSHRIIGLMSGLLISVTPAYVKSTIVPYQEGFMLLLGAASFLVVLALRPRSRTPFDRRFLAVLLSLLLTLGVLVRYELWLLCLVLGGLGISRSWRSTAVARAALPGLGLAAIWVLTSPIRTPGLGLSPDRLVVRVGAGEDEGLAHVLVLSIRATHTLASSLGNSLTPIGIVLMLAGAWWMFRESKVKAIGWLILIAGVALLTIVRAVNSSVMTQRMMVLPLLLILPLVAAGLVAVAIRGKSLPGLVAQTLMLSVLLAASIIGGLEGIQQAARSMLPEYRASRLLEELPKSSSVWILPRQLPNPWNESLASAIFANNLTLNPHDKRYAYSSFDSVNGGSPPYALTWCRSSNSYRLLPTRLVPGDCRQPPVDKIGEQPDRQ